MKHEDVVLNLFCSHPSEKFSNSDIVSRTGIKPHQQVFQITDLLLRKGLIQGEKSKRDWAFWASPFSMTKKQKASCVAPLIAKHWQGLLANFRKVAALAGTVINDDMIHVEILPAPHTPPKNLPQGKMAVYIFSMGDQTLKVGKAGSKSKARYISQHYNPKSAPSTLAASILADKDFMKYRLDEVTIGNWMKTNLDRVNLLLDQNISIRILTLLESFLQCSLNPKFEGFDSQK